MQFKYDYDYARQHWDRFKHFHMPSNYGYHPFVRFATGELAVDNMRWRPAMRKFYPEYNVTLASSRDKIPDLYTVDGERVPKAWLNHSGSNTLLIDHDTKRVVRINYRGMRDVNVPEYMRTMAGGFLAAKAVPVSGVELWARPPTSLTDTPERKEWREALHAMCRAWAALEEKELNRWDYARPICLLPKYYEDEPAKAFATMVESNRCVIARHGVRMFRDTIKYPYLVIK